MKVGESPAGIDVDNESASVGPTRTVGALDHSVVPVGRSTSASRVYSSADTASSRNRVSSRRSTKRKADVIPHEDDVVRYLNQLVEDDRREAETAGSYQVGGSSASTEPRHARQGKRKAELQGFPKPPP